MAEKIKKGDEVVVLSGAHKGSFARVSTILRVDGRLFYYVTLEDCYTEIRCTEKMVSSTTAARIIRRLEDADLNERW